MKDAILPILAILAVTFGVYTLMDSRVPKKDVDKQPVTIHNQDKIAGGMSLHTVRKTAKAWLVDNEGVIRQKWNIKKFVPSESKYTLSKSPLQHVEPYLDGTLLAVIKDSAVVRLNTKSELLSTTEGHFHHDLDVLADGTIVALERKAKEVTFQNSKGVLLDDHIILINKDGSRRSEHSLFDVVSELIPRQNIEHAFTFSASVEEHEIRNDTPADVLHTNSVEILRQDLGDLAPAGSALLSFRELDLVALIDFKAQKLLWSYGPGEISSQHAPTLLDNGNILIFDNGRVNKSTRIIEVNPLSNEIEWQFDASHYDEPKFYSSLRGNAQRLSNGNTLISVAKQGKIIEVTPDKEIVWKYAPRIKMKSKNNDGKQRYRNVMIYRVHKIEDQNLLDQMVDG